ncbi:MAG: hypothetical protein QM743_13415 [Chitinophagaceae bacterium]
MENSRLQDDLLREFREEKEMIATQLDKLVPLGVALRKPVAARVLNKIVLLASELLCYSASLGSILFVVFRDRIYPFYILSRLRLHPEASGFSKVEVEYLYWSTAVMAAIVAFLFIVIGRCLNRIRRKNAILQMAGNDVKTIVGEHLKRKAALDAIDQRHFGILEPLPAPDVVAVMNQGY